MIASPKVEPKAQAIRTTDHAPALSPTPMARSAGPADAELIELGKRHDVLVRAVQIARAELTRRHYLALDRYPKPPEALIIRPGDWGVAVNHPGGGRFDADDMPGFRRTSAQLRQQSSLDQHQAAYLERADEVLAAWDALTVAEQAAEAEAGVPEAEELADLAQHALWDTQRKIVAIAATTQQGAAVKARVVQLLRENDDLGLEQAAVDGLAADLMQIDASFAGDAAVEPSPTAAQPTNWPALVAELQDAWTDFGEKSSAADSVALGRDPTEAEERSHEEASERRDRAIAQVLAFVPETMMQLAEKAALLAAPVERYGLLDIAEDGLRSLASDLARLSAQTEGKAA